MSLKQKNTRSTVYRLDEEGETTSAENLHHLGQEEEPGPRGEGDEGGTSPAKQERNDGDDDDNEEEAGVEMAGNPRPGGGIGVRLPPVEQGRQQEPKQDEGEEGDHRGVLRIVPNTHGRETVPDKRHTAAKANDESSSDHDDEGDREAEDGKSAGRVFEHASDVAAMRQRLSNMGTSFEQESSARRSAASIVSEGSSRGSVLGAERVQSHQVSFRSSSIKPGSLRRKQFHGALDCCDGCVGVAALSIDGTVLAVAGNAANGKLELWDTQTWKRICVMKNQRGTDVTAIATTNSRTITGDSSGQVKMWHTTGRQIHIKPNAAFSEAGRTKTDGGSHTQLFGMLRGGIGASEDTGAAALAAAAKTGLRNPLTSRRSSSRIADIATRSTKDPRNITEPVHAGAVNSVSIAPTGKIFATAGGDVVFLWDLLTGTHVGSLRGHASVVHSIDFSPDARWLVSGSQDKLLKLWYVKRARCVRTLRGHTGAIVSVAISTDGAWLASAGRDRTVKLWDFDTGDCFYTLDGHEHRVTSVVVTHDTVISGSTDGTVRIWSAEVGECIMTLENPGGERIQQLLRGPEGSAFFTVATGLRLWQREVPECMHTLMDQKVSALAVGSDGSVIAGGDAHGNVKVYERTNSMVRTVVPGTGLGAVLAIAVCSESARVIAACQDGAVRVWHLETGELLMTLDGHEGAVNAVVARPGDSATVFTAGADKTIRAFNLDSGQCTRVLGGHLESVTALAVPRDGQHLVSGSKDSTLKVWENDMEHCVTLKGHNGGINTAVIVEERVFSERTHIVLTGSDDHTIKLWAMETGQYLRTMEGHASPVMVVRANAEGTVVVSGSEDGTILMWDRKTGACFRTLTEHSSQVLDIIVTQDEDSMIVSATVDELKFWDGTRRRPAPATVRSTFEDELLAASKVRGAYTFPRMENIFRQHPMSLLEKSTEDSSTVMQAAIAYNRPDFLHLFLPKEGIEERLTTLESAAVASALLDGTLRLALQHRSQACVKLLLHAYKLVLNHEREANNPDAILETERQWDALVDIEDIRRCAEIFPNLAQRFFNQIRLVPAFHFVQGDLKKYGLSANGILVRGSKARSPEEFWPRTVGGNNDGNDGNNEFPIGRAISRSNSSRAGSSPGSVTPGSGVSISRLSSMEEHAFQRPRPQALGRREQFSKLSNSKFGTSFSRLKLSASARFTDASDEVEEEATEGVPVRAMLVGLRGLASNTGILDTIVTMCKKTDRFDVFESDVMRALLLFKWENHVRGLFLRDFAIYLVLVVSFSVGVLTFESGIESGREVFRILAVCPLVLTTLIWLYFMRHEYLQVRATKRLEGLSLLRAAWGNLHDVWNVVDAAMLTLVPTSVAMQFADYMRDDGDFSRSAMAVALSAPVVYFKLMFFFQGMEESGVLLRMVIQITFSMGYFLLILCILMLSFALSFFVLVRAGPGEVLTVCGPSTVADYNSFSRSILSAFNIMLGEFSVQDFKASTSFWLMAALFVVFSLLVTIVLLNLLIAIMGDKYDQVQENATAEWRYALATIVKEYESLLWHTDDDEDAHNRDKLSLRQQESLDEKTFEAELHADGTTAARHAGGDDADVGDGDPEKEVDRRRPVYLQVLSASEATHGDGSLGDHDGHWGGKIKAIKHEILSKTNARFIRLSDQVKGLEKQLSNIQQTLAALQSR